MAKAKLVMVLFLSYLQVHLRQKMRSKNGTLQEMRTVETYDPRCVD